MDTPITVTILYYSGYGHTEVIAKAVHAGAAAAPGTQANIIKISKEGKISDADWQTLHDSHAIIFGTPTYMGSAAAALKSVMEASSKLWLEQKWKDKIAGGFTNSGSLSGDKLCTMNELVVFAAQHSMIWVTHGELARGRTDTDINRLGSYIGVMTQSDQADPSVSPGSGDIETAKLYGKRVAEATKRWNS